MTLDSALAPGFDRNLRHSLDPVWHKTNIKTRGLANDIKTLRRLISILGTHDCVSYLGFLHAIRGANAKGAVGGMGMEAAWLLLPVCFYANSRRLQSLCFKLRPHECINETRLGV